MTKRKKLTKSERKEQRLRKARQWLTTYQGTPKHMVKHYRERFHLDTTTALRDLQEIGVQFTQEYLDAVKRSEAERIRQKHLKDAAKREREMELLYADCDGRFAFIAGYTSGGVPYGLTWEDVGIDGMLPFDEKVRLLWHSDDADNGKGGVGHVQSE